MNKPHDKDKAASAPNTTTGPTDLAVVQPAQTGKAAQAAPSHDEFHGRGGIYRMVNGVRQRVAVTQPAATHQADAKEAKQ